MSFERAMDPTDDPEYRHWLLLKQQREREAPVSESARPTEVESIKSVEKAVAETVARKKTDAGE